MVGKGKVSQSGGSTPPGPPTSQEQNGENQPFSACFYLFFVFILPLYETHFPLMMPLNHDSPTQILSLPKSPLRAVRGFGWGNALILVMVVAYNSELKKKKKRQTDRQTDTFSNNAIPFTVPTHPHPIPVTHPTNTLI